MAKSLTKAGGSEEKSMRRLFARPVLPGQSVGHIEHILDHLRQECEPRGFIEEMWLADIASLTARIDYVCTSLVGMYRNGLRSDRVEVVTQSGPLRIRSEEYSPGEQQELESIEDAGFTRDDGAPAVEDPLFQRLLGLVTTRGLESIGKLTALEQMLTRERDRLIRQFERRRREKVREALHTLDVRPTDGAAT